MQQRATEGNQPHLGEVAGGRVTLGRCDCEVVTQYRVPLPKSRFWSHNKSRTWSKLLEDT